MYVFDGQFLVLRRLKMIYTGRLYSVNRKFECSKASDDGNDMRFGDESFGDSSACMSCWRLDILHS